MNANKVFLFVSFFKLNNKLRQFITVSLLTRPMPVEGNSPFCTPAPPAVMGNEREHRINWIMFMQYVVGLMVYVRCSAAATALRFVIIWLVNAVMGMTNGWVNHSPQCNEVKASQSQPKVKWVKPLTLCLWLWECTLSIKLSTDSLLQQTMSNHDHQLHS